VGGAWEAVVTTILSTDGVASQEREGFWRQALSETFVPMTVGAIPGDRFAGCLRSDWIGRLMVAEVASTAQDIQRTRREISRTDAAYLQIGMVYRGAARVAQDGREAVLGAGDFAVFETTRPFRWSFAGDWDVGAFTMARGSVGLSEAESRLLCARRLDGQAGLTGVVSRFLRDLARHADSLSGAQSERVLADVTDLVVTLLGDWAEDSEVVRSSVQRALMLRIKDYIECRLADPTLGPDEIAAAVNISTRYLHKLFAGEHRSVSQYVRGLRLERCRRDLLDPRLADQSIAAIAFRWGFGDLSSFNRAFRATFGTTPTRAPRASGGQRPPLAPRCGPAAVRGPLGMVRPHPRRPGSRCPTLNRPAGRPRDRVRGSAAGPARRLRRLAQHRPAPTHHRAQGVLRAVLSAPASVPRPASAVRQMP
jgi:AraC-like DNA-binding protein